MLFFTFEDMKAAYEAGVIEASDFIRGESGHMYSFEEWVIITGLGFPEEVK